MMPHLHHPAFLASEAFHNARALSTHLLDTDQPQCIYSMLIYKPPGHPHTTPWHCDLAYAGRPQTAAGVVARNNSAVQFRVALNDVAGDMRCMEFVPDVQDQPMPDHVVSSGDPADEGRLLAMTYPERRLDLATVVQCPLRAGSATVHGYTTPHFTGPNRSTTRGRRAFIFTFINPKTFELSARKRKKIDKSADEGDRVSWPALRLRGIPSYSRPYPTLT